MMGKQLEPLQEEPAIPAKTSPEAQLIERYKKKQEKLASKLTLEFERDLKKLAAQQSLHNVIEGIATEEDSSIASSEDSNETEANDSSEDEDSKVPLPPPADPDKSHIAGALPKRERPGVGTNGKLKSKKSKSRPKDKWGKENKKSLDKKQETNGTKPSINAGLTRPLPSGSVMGMKLNGTVINGDGVDSEKKERIRASKTEFKRLDELYVFKSDFYTDNCVP